jgi:two-component system, OmpR family, sensor histidine kinase KdpD
LARRIVQMFARHGYVLAVVAIALSTGVFLLGRDQFAKGQWALLYLLVILLVASAAGPGPAVLAAVFAFFAWNFFFLPPFHTLYIRDPKDWLALAAFLVVGVIVGALAGRMRDREAAARAREQESAALNQLSAAVVSQTSTGQMAETCLGQIVELLGARSAALYVERGGSLTRYREAPEGVGVDPSVGELAERTFSASEVGTSVPAAGDGGLYVPVRSPSGVTGVLTVQARPDGRAYSPADARLVTSLGNMVGAFLERERLQQAATVAAAAQEADQLKSSLLSSVSHELKTPLAALTATVSNLLESDVDWDEESVRDELRAIVGDVARLNTSITALLELSRLEAHAWEPRRELYGLGEIVFAGIDALPTHLQERVRVQLPEDEIVVDVDFVQFTRVMQTLLENALLYSTGEVTVGAHGWHDGVRLWVEDQGPGIPADEHEAVFEKFFRGRRPGGQRGPSGTGLGLAIAREIVLGHGGTISIDDVAPHGARFVITLTADLDPSDTQEEST